MFIGMDGFPHNILSLLLINAVNVMAKAILIWHVRIGMDFLPNILVLVNANLVVGIMEIVVDNNTVAPVMA
jgi:hypothetical protein